MANIPSVPAQITAVAESAQRLRTLAGRQLPVLDDQMYLRPVAHGCTIISINPDYRPQQGLSRRWGPTATLQSWKEELKTTLAERDSQIADGTRNTRGTPEKSLQSFLIREAIRNEGRMLALAAGCPESPQLVFLADEMALREPDGEKTVCDLLALRFDGDLAVLVAIELKNTRQLKCLTEQVHKMADFIEKHRAEFQTLAEACLGRPVRLATKAERWIVWPCAGPNRHGDQDPRIEKCRAENVRIITYEVDPHKGFVLHASSLSSSCPQT